MLKRILPLAALTAFLSGCGGGGNAAAPSDTLRADTVARVDDFISTQMREQHIPGLSLLINHNGKTVLVKGYGMADMATAMPVHAQTIFRIGSVSKQFAAAAVMLLVQDGRLNLDQRFAHYFPVAPPAWQDITIRQLLHHTAGLQRDFQDYLASIYDPNHNYTADELVQLMGAIPMQSTPGSAYSYSNMGYYLIGMLIERVSGQPYAEFMRDRMFAPLDMGSAALLSAPAIPGLTASGYDWRNNSWVRGDTIDPGDDGADGGLRMSVTDLGKWDLALNSDRILSNQSRAELWTSAKLNNGNSEPYGLGWVLDSVNQLPIYWHNGQVNGFHSQYVRVPTEGWSVIVLTNLSDAQAERISFAVASMLDPKLQ